MTEEQKKFYDIKTYKDYKTVGEDIDYIVLVDHEKKEVILQFEESDSRQDWKHNFMFLPWILNLDGNKVITTHGYACAYDSARGLPMAEFCSALTRYPDYRKIIRGWSFGSAMTKIATRHYYFVTGQKLDEVTTFGDVKCWLNPFLKSSKYAKVVHEYTYVNDFVTWCVPFFSRTKKCKVGDRFSFKKIFNTEYNHQHYEEYDYSKYES